MKIFYLVATFMITVSVAALGLAAKPFLKPNNAWITISGKIDSVMADQFILDFGEGKVRVEMDDGDRDADAYSLAVGDKVRVTGKIDRDLFEKTKIEAGSVYVENLNTTFFSSTVDEEDSGFSYYYSTGSVFPDSTTLYGTVSSVEGRKFSLKTGDTKLTVDTSKMTFNPLDNVGYLKIKKGDYIGVSGTLTKAFFIGHELEASNIVKYYEKVRLK